MADEQRAVLFADLDGYTALTEAHGDLDAVEVAERFVAFARDLLRGDARLVKTLGDAVLITTSEAADGVDIAVELVEAVDELDRYPSVSAGVHTGPVIERDGDVFGSTVNLAARTAAQAIPRQVLCTQATADRLDGDRRAALRELGSSRLAHIPDPVALYEVIDRSPAASVLDPVCHMRLDPRHATAWLQLDGHWHFCSSDCLRAFLDGPHRYLTP